jgi:hypothetical protein
MAHGATQCDFGRRWRLAHNDGDGGASSRRVRPNVAPDVPFPTPGLGPASTSIDAMQEMHARRRWGQLCLRVCAVPDRGTALEAARA